MVGPALNLQLSLLEARILGVLVEKERAVPDSYPLTLNALVSGANQKTSRDPVIEAAEPEIQAALDHLKSLSMVVESSGGRVMRYAHNVERVLGLPSQAVALLATHPGSVLEYAWDHPQVRSIERNLPCFVALPTTAGTGSEVGRSSVISDDTTHIKKIIFSPKLLAKAVFADPELTLDLPAKVTAATGMDALTHNVESYLSPAYHPLCDGIALEGARIAAHALVTAVTQSRNIQARSDMMMSSLMGAVAFQKDLGAVHSCAHALGTVVDMHHGLANGVMIDHVMKFNVPAAAAKMAELARVCGAGTTPQDFIAWLAKLKTEVGIPANLVPLGVKPEHIAALVDVAIVDTCHQTNPRPCTRGDFEQLFRSALA